MIASILHRPIRAAGPHRPLADLAHRLGDWLDAWADAAAAREQPLRGVRCSGELRTRLHETASVSAPLRF